VFIDRAPCTKLHKREQKDRTKTLAEFPNHVLKDYMFSVRDYDLAMNFVNKDLVRIRNWCFQNLLLLNPGKTHLMVYGSRQLVAKLPENFHISLLGKAMFPSETVKDLGVIFDPYLDFNEP
jgi:hypothetical protein